MARIRILELPMVHVGAASESPFVVILDQVADGSPFNSHSGVEEFGQVAKAWGAGGALVTTDTIDLADDSPPEASLAGASAPDHRTLMQRLREEAGDHDFTHPDFLDPVRCSRCGTDWGAWLTSGRTWTCSQALAQRGES